MKKLLLITATAIPLVAAGAMPGWSQQQQQPSAAQQANQQPTQSQQQGQQGTSPINLSQNEIKQMQGALDQKGYHAGRQDGKMGPMTESALRQFQKDQSLQQTGQPDQQTLAALGINEQQGANQAQPSTVGQGNNEKNAPNQSGASATTGQANTSNMQPKGAQNNQQPGSSNPGQH
ncbi:MAG TPA: peptidoglycan-binding domain-containing protein [Xanthobacteraceae bacterium]|jgi:peptidoglycan hydrolase-like protein with peptidoglycan-binding domain